MSILQNTIPAVTGFHGRDALATAIQISELIEKNIPQNTKDKTEKSITPTAV
jgi:hypothetical protein